MKNEIIETNFNIDDTVYFYLERDPQLGSIIAQGKIIAIYTSETKDRIEMSFDIQTESAPNGRRNVFGAIGVNHIGKTVDELKEKITSTIPIVSSIFLPASSDMSLYSEDLLAILEATREPIHL